MRRATGRIYLKPISVDAYLRYSDKTMTVAQSAAKTAEEERLAIEKEMANIPNCFYDNMANGADVGTINLK